ncbi:MAG: PorV/PorQ family protein [bacterium]
MKQLLITFIIIFICLPVSGYSETGDAGQAARYLRIGVGARALGIGGAFVSICDDASATYWNPAGLTQLTQREMTSMASLMSLDRRYNFLNYVAPLADRTNTIGFSLINFAVKDLREFVKKGEIDEEVGRFNDTENTFMVSCARKLNDKLAIGVNLKYLTQQMNPTRIDPKGRPKAKGLGIDIGTLYKLSDNINVGLMLQDIRSYLKWETDHGDRLPLVVKLGVSTRLFDDRLTLSADLEQIEDNHRTRIYAGLEYWLRENIGLRGGIFDTEPTAGLSFIFPLQTLNLQLDYSFAPDRFSDFKDNISGSERYNHRFSLSVKF